MYVSLPFAGLLKCNYQQHRPSWYHSDGYQCVFQYSSINALTALQNVQFHVTTTSNHTSGGSCMMSLMKHTWYMHTNFSIESCSIIDDVADAFCNIEYLFHENQHPIRNFIVTTSVSVTLHLCMYPYHLQDYWNATTCSIVPHGTTVMDSSAFSSIQA